MHTAPGHTPLVLCRWQLSRSGACLIKKELMGEGDHTDTELFNTKCKNKTSQLPKHTGNFRSRRKSGKADPVSAWDAASPAATLL